MNSITCLKNVLSNWRGGLAGVVVFLLAWVVFFFVAFMAAFGNDTPEARVILQVFSVLATISNPLWGIPLSYIAGSYMTLFRVPVEEGS
ncbi:MAG: hypothetical protein A4E35_00519 [Methanoregula sp. PtaU1.Bin051]|nr:MAG: hypothetical protein A4E35_00519 [Methanoregula sp. PtaU1.Bin051]